jgi:hypothetical protein
MIPAEMAATAARRVSVVGVMVMSASSGWSLASAAGITGNLGSDGVTRRHQTM